MPAQGNALGSQERKLQFGPEGAEGISSRPCRARSSFAHFPRALPWADLHRRLQRRTQHAGKMGAIRASGAGQENGPAAANGSVANYCSRGDWIMDLNYSSEEEQFRLKVRQWLEENLPKSGLRGEARMRGDTSIL